MLSFKYMDVIIKDSPIQAVIFSVSRMYIGVLNRMLLGPINIEYSRFRRTIEKP